MKWFSMETLAYIGNKLVLGEKEGACRDAYMVEYLNQEEPFGRYHIKHNYAFYLEKHFCEAYHIKAINGLR